MKQFHYVVNPTQLTILHFSDKPEACDICKKEKVGYSYSGYTGLGDEDINFVCEDCLSEGRLREKKLEANQGSPKILTKQLKELNPNASDEESKRIVKDKTDVIKFRTPAITSWQDHRWPVHHGDYCLLLGEMGKQELNSLASSGDGRKLLNSILYWTGEGDTGTGYEEEWDDEYRDWLWGYIPDHAPKENSKDSCSPLYLFQCIIGKEYIAMLDFD
jgi:uncharacterized protein CbrC (UPF0167 family)